MSSLNAEISVFVGEEVGILKLAGYTTLSTKIYYLVVPGQCALAIQLVTPASESPEFRGLDPGKKTLLVVFFRRGERESASKQRPSDESRRAK